MVLDERARRLALRAAAMNAVTTHHAERWEPLINAVAVEASEYLTNASPLQRREFGELMRRSESMELLDRIDGMLTQTPLFDDMGSEDRAQVYSMEAYLRRGSNALIQAHLADAQGWLDKAIGRIELLLRPSRRGGASAAASTRRLLSNHAEVLNGLLADAQRVRTDLVRFMKETQ